MRIRNRFFWLFLSISFFLFSGVLLAVGRFLPFIIQDNIYRCQAWFRFLSLEISPVIFRIVFFCIGLMFSVWMGLRLFFVLFRIRQLRKRFSSDALIASVLWPLLQRHDLVDRVFLVHSDRLFSFCFGFFYPKIYISTGLLHVASDCEMEAVLLHEKYHLDHKDSLVMCLAFLVEVFFPFFPVLSDLLTHYRVSREVSADRFAIVMLGGNSSLLSVLKKMLGVQVAVFSGTASLADELLEERIKCLVSNTSFRNKISTVNSLISLFSFFMLFFILITPVPVSAHVSQPSTMFFCSTDVKSSMPFSWAIDK